MAAKKTPLANEPALQHLDRLVGSWTAEATHPALPGTVLRGTAEFEWLDGKRFLIQRTHIDPPEFPDAISVIGFTDQDRVDEAGKAPPPVEGRMTMHYFDSRGV